MTFRNPKPILFAALSVGMVSAALATSFSDEAAPSLPPPLTDEDFLYDGAPDAARVELGATSFLIRSCRAIAISPAAHAMIPPSDRVMPWHLVSEKGARAQDQSV